MVFKKYNTKEEIKGIRGRYERNPRQRVTGKLEEAREKF